MPASIPTDRFQDFYFLYIVTDVSTFIMGLTWIDHFGECMILQTPDLMGDNSGRKDGGFTYLMQFTDGSRIDLTLIPIDRIADIEEDSLSVLLDKDVIYILFPQPSETSYLPKPSAQA